MFNKKSIAIAVSALLMFSLLSACGGSSAKTTTTANAQTTAVSKTESSSAAATTKSAETAKAAETTKAAATTAADSQAAKSAGKYTADQLKGKLIYIITDTQQNAYFVAEAKGAESEAVKKGFTAKITSYESDINKEGELCDAAIAEGAVAIIWDVADSEASVTSVKKAKDAGIPTFCTSRELNTTGVAVSQIVADNAGGTKGVAEKFVEKLGEKGKYAELYGMDGDNNSKVRSDAYHSVIDQYPDLTCVDKETSNFNMTEAYNDTESILQTYPDIKGIVTANDTEALGAWQACVDANRSDIVVVGVDGSDEVAASIKKGGILATALQPCVLETQMAVQQAFDYLTTGKTNKEEKQIVDSPVIDSSNCDKLKGFYLSE